MSVLLLYKVVDIFPWGEIEGTTAKELSRMEESFDHLRFIASRCYSGCGGNCSGTVWKGGGVEQIALKRGCCKCFS
jgi:hypothetical protein